MESLRSRAELKQREWVEFEFETDGQGVAGAVRYKAWGCHRLIEAAQKAAVSFKGKRIADLQWDGLEHWDLLIQEAVDRLQGRFGLPYKEEELCHCRKIPTVKVDEAIVLGAHTPEKVTKWTTASSGCGTCRPDVENLIAYRTKKSTR